MYSLAVKGIKQAKIRTKKLPKASKQVAVREANIETLHDSDLLDYSKSRADPNIVQAEQKNSAFLPKTQRKSLATNNSLKDYSSEINQPEGRKLTIRISPFVQDKILFFPDKEWLCNNLIYYEKCTTVGCPRNHKKKNSPFMVFVEMLRSAKRKIDICVYIFNQQNLAILLKILHELNIKIRVFTNSRFDSHTKKVNQVLLRLIDAGIEVRFNEETRIFEGLMHHKFAVVDDEIVAHGSLNWTNAAFRKNAESMTISWQPNTVKGYADEFSKIWKSTSPLKSKLKSLQV